MAVNRTICQLLMTSIKHHLSHMACFLKIKLRNIKMTFLILKTGSMTKLMMNLFVQITNDSVLKDTHTKKIDMGSKETLNCMSAMIVQIAP